jgi:hypothetical protein
MTEAERLIHLEHAVETARWARTRLEQFADGVMHGVIQGGGRELKRKVWGAFSDFEEALKAFEADEVNQLHIKTMIHVDAMVSMAHEGYALYKHQYVGRRYICLAEALLSIEKALPKLFLFDINKLSTYHQRFPAMLTSKVTGKDFRQAAERAYFHAVAEHFRPSIERRLAEQFEKLSLAGEFAHLQELLGKINLGAKREVLQALSNAQTLPNKQAVGKLVVELGALHENLVHWSVNCGRKGNDMRQEIREVVELAEYFSLGVAGSIDIFGSPTDPEIA